MGNHSRGGGGHRMKSGSVAGALVRADERGGNRQINLTGRVRRWAFQRVEHVRRWGTGACKVMDTNCDPEWKNPLGRNKGVMRP
jgi:hypothetical protein